MFNYIAVEGIDGTGKTTLARNLARLTKSEYMYEPYGQSEVTLALRKFALQSSYTGEVTKEAKEYMMLANRAISTNMISKMLIEGNRVIQDRSLVSGMAYAYVASGYSMNEWWSIAKLSAKVIPDLVIYVTTDEQKIKKVEGDIYDNANINFHESLKSAFPSILSWFSDNLGLKVFHFRNDFNIKPEDNAKNLAAELRMFKLL